MKELRFKGNVGRWFVDVQEQFGRRFVIISSKQCVNVMPAEEKIGEQLRKDLLERLVCACSDGEFEKVIGFAPKQHVRDVIRDVSAEMERYPQQTLVRQNPKKYAFSRCANVANPSADPLHGSNFLGFSTKFVDYPLLVERAWAFSELYKDEVRHQKDEDDLRYDQNAQIRKMQYASPPPRSRPESLFKSARGHSSAGEERRVHSERRESSQRYGNERPAVQLDEPKIVEK